MKRSISIIGSGFSGLAAACFLAKEGHEVHLVEKNLQPGGRARKWESQGYMFDMGPSWYWMPEVFENFFNHFGKRVSDFYELVRLDPSYRVYFGQNDIVDVPASTQELAKLFNSMEPGSATKLDTFLQEAEYKYTVGMQEFVFKPAHSVAEFFDLRIIKNLFRLQLLQSHSKHIARYFKNSKLSKILEFPVLFLGAAPQQTPALYSLMNYADLKLGTWYPLGGMHQIIDAMVSLATELGVIFHLGEEVVEIEMQGNNINQLITTKRKLKPDMVVAAADYHHVEQNLLPAEARQYSPEYWSSRTMAPSSLIFYLGVNKRLQGLRHHNLFFDESLDEHAKDIYDNPRWPRKPLFYVCAPSITDPSVAPEGCENLFVLVPLAPGLEDNESTREAYFDLVMRRIKELTSQSVKDHIVLKRSYAMQDFKNDYHSYKGNAYGLANTLRQTAFLKPKMKSRKVKNLYYTGQLTTPGPGVPPSLISGQVVAREISKHLQTTKHL